MAAGPSHVWFLRVPKTVGAADGARNLVDVVFSARVAAVVRHGELDSNRDPVDFGISCVRLALGRFVVRQCADSHALRFAGSPRRRTSALSTVFELAV